MKSLAEAHVHTGVAWPRLIVDDDRAGFLMAFLDIDRHGDGSVVRSGLWRLNGFRGNGETSGGQTVGVLELSQASM